MSFWNTIAGGFKSAGNTIAGGFESAGNKIAGGFESAGNSFAGAVESSGKIAWEGASDEARALGRGVETAGMKISDGFLAGAAAVKTGMDEGVEKVVEGAEVVKEFVEKNVCDIFVGSALSAVFVALAADGEEETAVATIAAAQATGTSTGFVDDVALKTAAHALATIISTPVYSIPGVSSSGLSKSELETAITFLIVKACKKKPKVVVGSAGQFLAGVLISGLTNLICEGNIPGGYQVWKGANASMFGTPGNVQPATTDSGQPVIPHPGWSGSHAFDVKFYLTIYPDLAEWNTTNTLAPGDVLRPGEYISSTSGAYYLTITSDGQLCVFGNTPSNELGESWRSGGKSDGPAYAVMLANGNFCLFKGTTSQGKLLWQWASVAQKNLLWQSATSGQTRFAILQDDGNLCVYAGNSQATQGAFAWGSLQNGGVVPPRATEFFGVNFSSIAAHNVSPEIAHRLSRVRRYAAALDHWLKVGIPEGRRGSREFDLSFYMQHYSDMPAAFGTNHAAVLDHWLTFGISEGRRGSREFDLSFYMQHYSDMPAAFGTNHAAVLDHWLNTGLPVEGRRGSAEFDVSFYLQSYPDLQAAFGNNYVAALDHWIIQGVREGRKGAPSA